MIRERATGWWHRHIVGDDETSAWCAKIDQELDAERDERREARLTEAETSYVRAIYQRRGMPDPLAGGPLCPACGGEWVDTEDGVVTQCRDSNCPTWDDIA